jgi:urease accessory protein
MRPVLFGLTLIAMFASPALAHPGPEHVHSFTSGVLHPLTGADHVLAMALVGLWATFVGGRAIWAWPATFVATMLAGFATARLGLQVSFVDPAISMSIIVLGLLVMAGVRAPLALGASIVGLVAFLHGHAHGTEAVAGNILSYAAGFTFSTGTLLAAGVGLGLCMRSPAERFAFFPMRRVRGAVRGGGALR